MISMLSLWKHKVDRVEVVNDLKMKAKYVGSAFA